MSSGKLIFEGRIFYSLTKEEITLSEAKNGQYVEPISYVDEENSARINLEFIVPVTKKNSITVKLSSYRIKVRLGTLIKLST